MATESWMAVRGTVIAGIAPEVIAITVLSSGVVGLHALGWGPPISPLAHSIVGIALGMLLVFRTNVSYDRYWEARRRWSGLASAARNLVRAAAPLEGGRDLAGLVAGYVHALQHHLRGQESWRPLRRWLPEATIRRICTSEHPPLAMTRQITDWLWLAEARGTLHPERSRSLEGYVAQLIDHQSACERIANTPVPFAYMTHVRQLLVLYIATLPLAVATDLGPWTIPAVALVAFGLLGIDRAGREIEDPFGDDPNDLPMGELAEAIARDVALLAGPEAGRTTR